MYTYVGECFPSPLYFAYLKWIHIKDNGNRLPEEWQRLGHAVLYAQ